MQSQSIHRSRPKGMHYLLFPWGEERENGGLENFIDVVLTKPDVTRNPKVDGYRKPSSYFTHVNASRRDNRTTFVPGKASFFPEGPVAPVPGTDWLGGFRGDGSLYVQNGDWAFPKGRPDALRTKIRNNVRDEILDVAMVLAEMAETASTGAQLMLRIGRSMQALRKWDRRSFEYLWDGRMPRDGNGKILQGRSLDRFNRQTAGAYLEWKYGIMPTVLDLQGVTEALDINEKGSLFDNPPLAIGRAVESYEVRRSIPLSIQEPGGTVAYSTLSFTDRVTHKARLDYRVEAEGMRGLNRYGLGLSSLPTILYDKTPFSFVFNMVCPIAEIIKAWGALAGCSVVGYCETLHVERLFETPPPAKSGRYPNSIQVIPSIDDVPCFHFERKAFASPPLPMPYLRNPVKVGNMASVLALFTQLRPKRAQP